jgi:NADH dehydrogenase
MMNAAAPKKRIVILGGGFGGVSTAVLAAGTVPDPVVAGLPLERDGRGRVVVEATMRCPGCPEVWALGDCAAIPGPDGKPYPGLAQHALRAARVLAGNVAAVLEGRPPRPFVYHTLGMMGSLGHGKGFGQLLGVQVRGVPAWFVRRTYYLLQMPGWSRKLRIVLDGTLALLFRPDIVKIGLDSEMASHLYEVATREAAAGHSEAGGGRTGSATGRGLLAPEAGCLAVGGERH